MNPYTGSLMILFLFNKFLYEFYNVCLGLTYFEFNSSLIFIKINDNAQL